LTILLRSRGFGGEGGSFGNIVIALKIREFDWLRGLIWLLALLMWKAGQLRFIIIV
jgi:hypothetical protein